MDRALALAAAARRRTAPRPWVGCVVARAGEVVGEGATGEFPRGAHAEAVALASAGDRARGATAYVTLEPCNHHGRTPPCTDALIEAGVRRVVAALRDPDPRVGGRGFARMRAAGIEVVTGVRAREATRLLGPYLHQRSTGRPFVVVKVATSLDGRIAAIDGTSRWITSAEARADAHELRADSDAIVVGSGTALADRPSLTVRGVTPEPARPPLRVLLDSRARVSPDGPLFDTSVAPTLVVTTAGAPAERVDAWTAAGAKVEVVPAGSAGVDLDAVLGVLAAEHALQVLVEGGGALIGSFLAGGYAQRLVAYVAPTILGTGAPSGYAWRGPATLADASRYRLAGATVLGPDVRLDYELTER